MTCFAEGIVWGIQHWRFLALGWGLILMLRWGPLGALSSLNVIWGLEFSGDPKSWSEASCLTGSGPTPYSSIKTSQATQHRRQNPQTEKQISIAKNTQRGSHTYKEKREGEKGKQKMIKEGSKRRVIIKSDQ